MMIISFEVLCLSKRSFCSMTKQPRTIVKPVLTLWVDWRFGCYCLRMKSYASELQVRAVIEECPLEMLAAVTWYVNVNEITCVIQHNMYVCIVSVSGFCSKGEFVCSLPTISDLQPINFYRISIERKCLVELASRCLLCLVISCLNIFPTVTFIRQTWVSFLAADNNCICVTVNCFIATWTVRRLSHYCNIPASVWPPLMFLQMTDTLVYWCGISMCNHPRHTLSDDCRSCHVVVEKS